MKEMADVNRDKYYTAWLEIQDLIGPASHWPKKIRKLFWTKNVKHFDRLLISAFAYNNGLCVEALLDWVNLYGLCRDASGVKEIKSLYEAYEKGIYYNLYAYNLHNKRYENLDGSRHIFRGEKDEGENNRGDGSLWK